MSDLWRLALGHRLGQGGSRGIASYLPALYGVVPIWHWSETTPDTTGAISAIADVSLGLYPLSQGTPANQLVRDSNGYIVSANGTDNMASVDATLLGYGDLTSHDACLMVAGTVGTVQAGTRIIAGWNNASNGNRLEVSGSELFRLRKETTVANSATDIVDSTMKSMIVHFQSGAEGDVLGYINGTLVQTLAVTGSATPAPTSFNLGGTGASGSTDNRIMAACAFGSAPTTEQRAQWDAWTAAGCPL